MVRILWKLALVSVLLISLVVGLLLFFRPSLERQGVAYLRSFLSERCQCEVTIEGVELALNQLTLKVGRFQMRDDKSELEVSETSVDIDIKKFLSPALHIRRVHVPSIRSKNFFTGEIPKRFSGEPSSDKGQEGRVKVTLGTAEVTRIDADEKLGEELLQLREGSVKAQQIGERYDLKNSIADIKIVRADAPEITLGRLATDLSVEGKTIKLQSLTLESGHTFIQAAAQVVNDVLSGSLSHRIDTTSLGIDDVIEAKIEGENALEGTVDAPAVRGNLLSEAPLKVKEKGREVIRFDSLTTTYEVSYSKENGVGGKITTLSAQGPLAVITLEEPISLSPHRLTGGLKVQIDDLAFSTVSLRDLTASIKLDGPLLMPLKYAEGSVGHLEVGPNKLSPLTFNARSGENAVLLTLDYGGGNGTLSGEALVAVKEKVHIERAVLTVTDFALPHSDDPALQKAIVSATVHARGEPALEKLELHGDVTTRLRGELGDTPITTSLALEKGLLRVEGEGFEKKVSYKGNVELGGKKPSSLSLEIEDLSLQQFAAPLECGALSLNVAYTFELAEPTHGDGALDIREAKAGCGAYEASIPRKKFPIDDGSLDVTGLQLLTKQGSVTMKGRVSPEKVDITLKSDVNIAPLAPLIPGIDEAEGVILANVKVEGALASPRITGDVDLKEGELLSERLHLVLDDITLDAKLQNNEIQLWSLKARANDGTLSLQGKVPLNSIEDSIFHLKAEDLEYSPVPDLSALVSGDLAFALKKQPHISGTITIKQAEFEKRFDPYTVVTSLQNIFSRKEPPPIPSTGGTPLGLDLSIQAPGQLFILTNLTELELGSDLHIRGTSQAPKLEGAVKVINGWFGVGDRRFDIVYGRTDFTPRTLDPKLEIRAETTIASPTQEEMLVTLEVSGTASSPKVRFFSDKGLSQAEVLRLITGGGGGAAPATLAGAVSRYATAAQLSIVDEEDEGGWRNLLATLTHLDSLTVRPSLNAQTGAIEPTILAQKRLSRDLMLQGSTAISRSGDRSQVMARYDISSKLQVRGSVTAPTSVEPGSLSTDIAYDFIPETPLLEIKLYGFRKMTEDQVLTALRVTERSRLRKEQLPLIAERLVRFYRSAGHLGATVRVECTFHEALCREMSVNIEEGPQSRVEDIVLVGEMPEGAGFREGEALPDPGSPATQKVLDATEKTVLAALRRAGYLGARVTARYVPLSTEQIRLRLEIRAGRKTELRISGNKEFDDKELLAIVNFEDRKLPFGRGSLAMLGKEVTDFYRARGFEEVKTKVATQQDSEGKFLFSLNISEGRQIQVGKISVEGPDAPSRRQLRKMLNNAVYSRIFEPHYFSRDEVNYGAYLILTSLKSRGYPHARVETTITVADSVADIRYRITRGEAELVHELEISPSLPPEVDLPQIPKLPAPLSVVEQFEEDLVSSLSEQGYLGAKVEMTYVDPKDRSSVIVRVELGERSTISTISVEGLSAIGEEKVREILRLKKGDPWDSREIGEARGRIFGLGLFLDVSLEPKDGAVDEIEEDLVLKVMERDMRSFTAGVGADSVFGLHLFSEGQDKSLFKDGRSITLRTDLYYDPTRQELSRGIGSLRYVNPFFLSTDTQFSEELSFRRSTNTTQEFDVNRFALSTLLSRTFNNGLRLTGGHTLSQDQIQNIEDDVELSDLDRGDLLLSMFSGSVSYDRRDDLLNPRRGYLLSLDGRYSAEQFGSEANFYSLEGRFTWILPTSLLNERLSFATTTRFGKSWTFGDTPHIPVTQRYYLGGRGRVRGFRENELGPRGSQGGVLGGDALFAESFEVRYALQDNVTLHTFLDAGNVFLEGREKEGLRFSAGIGARYLSPIGPIGLEIGAPLDEKSGEPSFRIHFSIGTM